MNLKKDEIDKLEARIEERVYQRINADMQRAVCLAESLFTTPDDTRNQSPHRGASTRPLERFEAYQPTASSAVGSDAKTEINTLKKEVQAKARWVSRLLGDVDGIDEIDILNLFRRARIDTLQCECENLSKMLSDLLYQDRMLRHQSKS